MTIRNMTIRKKILLFSVLALGAFLVAVSLVSRFAFFRTLTRLEADFAREDVSRLQSALQSEQARLDILAVDYGQWDQTYNFMAGQNPGYVDTELSVAALQGIQVSCVALLDAEDHVVFFRTAGDWTATDTDMREIATAHERAIERTGKNRPLNGTVELNGRLLMVSYQPIVPTKGGDSSRGTLAMVRRLDGGVLGSISRSMGTPAWLEPPENIADRIPGAIWSDGSSLARVESDASMLNYLALRDFSGATRGFLVARTPRVLYSEGEIKIYYLWSLLLLAGAVFCSALFFFVDGVLVRRIGSLSRDVSRITVSGDLSLRLDTSGKDELSELAQSINAMLGAIQKAKAELEQAQESLRFHAEHDALTGILNRRAIRDVLRKELARCRRDKNTLGVILADLDHFKKINDLYGHGAGDTVLVTAVQRIASTLRSYDSVGRYGGEEFLLIAPGCDLALTQKLAERVRAAIGDEPIDLGVDSARISVSLGVTLGTADSDPEFLVALADTALYQAKRNGRNRVEVGLETEEEPADIRFR